MPHDIATTASAEPAAPTTVMDIDQIQQLLPHRYPFLLIDRVVEIEKHRRVVAIKNVTANEPYFMGHFPGYPLMPGVLIVEAIAQAAGALLLSEVEDRENKLMVFASIERARFRRPVRPGDQLRLEAEVTAWRSTAVKMQGKAFVDGKVAADVTITCRLLDKPRAGASTATTEDQA